jgi:uncharacterized protein
MGFRSRYGPWALVAGASEGIGEAFARQIAAKGVGVVLVARREGPLTALAHDLSEGGAEVRTAAVDLTSATLLPQLEAVTRDLDIGLVVYNAGATLAIGPFMELGADHALELMHLNCRGPLLLTHHFGSRMVERGSGGIVIVTSGAAIAGAANLATYAASKAFELVLAESLWAELRDRGVDVLACVAGATNTPSLIASGAKLDAAPLGVMQSDEVAVEALARLADGPTLVVGEGNREAFAGLWPIPRADLVQLMSAANASMFGIDSS